MAITEIDKRVTTTASTIPTLKDRNTVITLADQDEFVEKFEANNDHLRLNTTVEINQIGTEINEMAVEFNTLGNEVQVLRNDTETIKNEATSASQIAQSSANFKGNWSDLTGGLLVPASVYYNGIYYMLLENIPTVSAENPATSSKFAEIKTIAEIKTPVAVSPLSGATDVSLTPNLEASTYLSIYSNNIRDYRKFQLDLESGDFTSSVFEYQDDVDSVVVDIILNQSESYKWRCIDVGIDGTQSNYSAVQKFSTGVITIATPTMTISGEPSEVPETPTIELSAFTVMGGTDTHLNTDYQILDDQLDIVWESLGDTVNKLSITVPSGYLEVSNTYTFRARQRGNLYGVSAWKTKQVTTKAQFTPTIGTQGTKGFSVAPTDEPFAALGLSEMTGTNTVGHDNYGNYIHTNGSIVCWLVKGFYRVGHVDSPRYAEYGANAIDIVGTETFATETEANAGGYKLHRVFKNNGMEQPGYFWDKYKNTDHSGNQGKSVFGGNPISLTTSASYNNSSALTGCTGILADAVVLAKARGARWNATTAFAFGWAAIVSLAQGQAATNTDDCAWYDATGTKNYPKGCNNGSLSDVDDSSVTYNASPDTAAKPLAGATANFNKTTHNGSANGVADLNGGMYEPAFGITNIGTSATATTAIATDLIYILKESVDYADMTGGWDGATDLFGNTTNLSLNFDSFTSPHALGSATGTVYWGNGTNGATADDERIAGFIPKDNDATNATGTNQFGNDYFNKYNRQNLAARCCGSWLASGDAGLFYRYFYNYRSSDSAYSGFRSLAYVS